jgi:hypothetical protein
MGWFFFPNDNRETIVKRAMESLDPMNAKIRGNRIWAVTTYQGKRMISLALLQSSGGGWGCKLLSELEYPYYFDCPMSLLRTVDPPLNENAARWRAEVLKHHEREKELKNAIRPGSVVELGGRHYRLEENLGRRGWVVVRDDGMRFRMPSRQLRSSSLISSAEPAAA